MNQKVIITRGLSGSGKTTWSKQFVKDNPTYMRISRDDIDFMLSDSYPRKKATLVFRARDTLITQALETGFDLVLDETYLAPKRIKELNFVLEYYVAMHAKNLDVAIEDFINVPIDQCIKRDGQRFFHVGQDFIKEYHKKYIKPLLKDPGKTSWTIRYKKGML